MTIAIAAKSDPAPSQSELAQKLGVEGATIVAMVDRLVRAGLVRRQASTTDRRVKRVMLTTAGTEIYRTLRAEADQVLQQMLNDSDAKKLLGATEFLERLQRRIDGV
jgi:MarR family transcriptional regulator for hemolysin